MSSLSLLALDHLQRRDELSGRVARRAALLWRSVEVQSLDAGWDRIAPQLEQVVAAGQYQAAVMAPRYTSAALSEQGAQVSSGAVVASAFTGVTLDGREVAPELYSAATTTKRLIAGGVGVGQAFRVGTSLMSLMAGQMVRDAGNMADKVSGVARGTVQYARVLNPGACSRCAILSGTGNFTKHFERHPGCKCTTVPVRNGEQAPQGIFSSAGEYFNSLSKGEQDRIFTKAGAEAIRNGASETAVVNARAGMFAVRQEGSLVARATQRTLLGPDGKPFQAYTTTAGTTVRGWYGGGRGGSMPGSGYVRASGDRYRRTTSVRLMPETIMQLADGDPAKAKELLRRFGYLPS